MLRRRVEPRYARYRLELPESEIWSLLRRVIRERGFAQDRAVELARDGETFELRHDRGVNTDVPVTVTGAVRRQAGHVQVEVRVADPNEAFISPMAVFVLFYGVMAFAFAASGNWGSLCFLFVHGLVMVKGVFKSDDDNPVMTAEQRWMRALHAALSPHEQAEGQVYRR